ncbi:MAG: DeoR/GlpR family DNA-binding transcription regulator [Paracoccus hibiscisoli]|uniref:DeoR/GlpR family DNA-binding transcription regulator n=1 Tax=Paracoccus hibiscisoli TaxID=2023261 RepID=UPI00391C1C24
MDIIPSDSRQARRQARRTLIAQAVLSEGQLRIEDLTARFGISLMTAHRDLDDLAARGVLRKARGVVSAAPTSLVEASDLYRDTRQAPQKSAIAALAARQIDVGQAVFLDDSTTVLRMVPHLAALVPLTVITNALTLMGAVKDMRDLTLLGLGGQYHAWCNAFMGPQTTAQITRLRADLAIVSMAAITEGRVFHQSPDMAATKRAMLDAAGRRILLADHTKFTRHALHSMGGVEDFDLVVTDDRTPADQITALRRRGVAVQIAAVEG